MTGEALDFWRLTSAMRIAYISRETGVGLDEKRADQILVGSAWNGGD
jgi:hypothetical protein